MSFWTSKSRASLKKKLTPPSPRPRPYKQKKEQRIAALNEREQQKKLQELEDSIAQAEEELAGIEQSLSHPETLSDENIAELSKQHEQVQMKIDELMDEWEGMQG